MRNKKSVSIAQKLTIPMVLILLIQSGLSLAVMLYGGLMDTLYQNAVDILNQRIINRKNDLEREMTGRWANIHDYARILQNTCEEFLDTHPMETDHFLSDDRLTASLLSQLSSDLIYLIRRQSVTGAFLVLNRTPDASETSDFTRPGLYLRNLNPLSEEPDNSDLLVERGPASVVYNLEIPVSTNWFPYFRFGDSSPVSSDDYFGSIIFSMW